MDYVNAFWVGGSICALVQILLDKTKLLPGRVMVLLVCSGAVLGAVGIYEPFTKFAGAGATFSFESRYAKYCLYFRSIRFLVYCSIYS